MSDMISIGRRKFWIDGFTGTVKSVRQWTETRVSGGGGGGGVLYQGYGFISGTTEVTSTTIDHCEFFLSDGITEQRFQCQDLQKGFRQGHVLTVLWAGTEGASAGRVVYIGNQTTRDREFVTRAMRLTFYPPDHPLLAGVKALALIAWLFPFGFFLGLAALLGLANHYAFFGVVAMGAIWIGPVVWFGYQSRTRTQARLEEMIRAVDAAARALTSDTSQKLTHARGAIHP